MIKDINRQEIEGMQERLKVIQMLKDSICDKKKYQDFLDMKMNLREAVTFYKSCNAGKIQISSKEYINTYMVKYLSYNDIISETIADELITYFSSTSVYDVMRWTKAFINLFEEICNKFDIEMDYDYYCNIVEDDDIQKEFEFIQIALRSDISDHLEINEIDTENCDISYLIDDVFQDDALVFCFKNRKISKDMLDIINLWLPDADSGFITEVYEHEENLYLDISENDIFYILNFEFILIFICSLVKECI